MNHDLKSDELKALASVRSRYEQSGYEFIVEPQRDRVPKFLEGVRPDAIAIRGNEGVVIKVKSTRSDADNSALVKFLANEIPKHKGWDFELVLVEPNASEVIPSKIEIFAELDQIRSLIRQGNSKVAILFAWGLLEAAIKHLQISDGTNIAKRHLPNTVVEYLVSNGFVDQATGEKLAQAGRIRTALVHGLISTSVPADVMEALVETIASLLSDNSQNGFHEK